MKSFGVRASIALIVAGVMVFGGVATSASAAPRDDVVSLTNQQRSAAGLPALIGDPSLNAAAQEWAQNMSNAKNMVHSTNEWRAARIPAGWNTNGENIAYGYGSASAVMTGWMNSPGHKENILRSGYTRIGVGYVASGNYWVQIFAGYAGDTDRGRNEISALHQSMGGDTGSLGAPAGDFVTITSNGGGVVRAYASGAIAWSYAGGAFAITGAIRTQFNAAGGIGSLGWPVSSANSIAANGGGLVQGFQRAAVVAPKTSGAVVLKGDIRSYFNSIGGLAGAMGWPTSVESCAPNSCTQAFQGGTIYLSSLRAPTHVTNAFAPAYASMSWLGSPVTGPVQVGASGGGTVQAFENGALAKQTSGSIQALSGATRAVFNTAGGVAGAPGWPTGGVACAADKCTQSFQNGAVHTLAGSGAFVPSKINSAYVALGGLGGAVGKPVSAANASAANGGGTVQAFVGGAIVDSPRGGTHLISGALRAYFNEKGGLGGRYGWAAGDQSCDSAGVCSQAFLGGTLVWSPTTGGSTR